MLRELLCQNYNQLGVFFVQDSDLGKYCKNEKGNLTKMNSEKLAKRFTSKTFKKIMGVKVTIEDFEMIKPLGIGATAEVKLARFKINDCLYAIKIIQKHMLDFDNK